MEDYRVLVTGSRDWPNPGLVHHVLNHTYCEASRQRRRMVLVQGKCPKGADAQAVDWARCMIVMGFPVLIESHPADWNGPVKRGAGYRRNAEMVKRGAEVCHAFIKDSSKGSMHCSGLAVKAGIPTYYWEY